MGKDDNTSLVPAELIHGKIRVIRGQRVLLDSDLAVMYEVETRTLVQAVQRNIERFPEDFMFRLDFEEVRYLKSQSVISSEETPAQSEILRSQSVTSSSWGGRRTPPYAFTEQGVAMLSSVLRSPRAITVNVAIMRAFVQLRGLIERDADVARQLDELRERIEHHDRQFLWVFDAIQQILDPPAKPKRRVGFVAPEE